jgi:hypothetical protein
MKLYLKKLRNAEELEREKRLLLKEKKRLENEDFFPGISISGIVNNTSSVSSQQNASSGQPAADTLSSGIMSMAAPLAGLLFDIVQQRIMGGGKAGGKDSVANSIIDKSLKKGGNILGAAAKEVIGGYLKWKAIELSYKGVTLIIRKQKKKKEARAAAQAAAS